MQLIITDAWLFRGKTIYLGGRRLAGLASATALLLLSVTAVLYHAVYLKGVSQGWRTIPPLAGSPGQGEPAQRDRYLRENLDVMAKRVGEMQAKMLQLESLGERVSGLAGLPLSDLKGMPGRGGALVSERSLSLGELQAHLNELHAASDHGADLLTVLETRLFDQKVRSSMVPTQLPVAGISPGSPFGWRIDPLTGRSALHTGLDFAAEPGTAILAAAGGVVVTQERQPDYGNLVELDHGNDLLTRYAHASRVFVKKGDLIKRGQKIAEVGSTGRSTGSHLHFEVLVKGVLQDPQKFLRAGQGLSPTALVASGTAAKK